MGGYALEVYVSIPSLACDSDVRSSLLTHSRECAFGAFFSPHFPSYLILRILQGFVLSIPWLTPVQAV